MPADENTSTQQDSTAPPTSDSTATATTSGDDGGKPGAKDESVKPSNASAGNRRAGASGMSQAKKKKRGKLLAGILSLILGSSVLGAIGGSYANHYFEKAKIAAQNTRLHEMEKREVYTALGKDIQKLESDLGNGIITFNYAVNHPKEKGFASNVEQAIDVVSDQMKVVNQTLGNAQVEDPIRQQMIGVLNELGPKLAQAQNDPRTLPGLVDLYNRSLKQRIVNTKKQIEEVRTKLHIEKKLE